VLFVRRVASGRPLLARAALLCALALPACSPPPPTLTVRVQSGLRAGDELRHVRASLVAGAVPCDEHDGRNAPARTLAPSDQAALIAGTLEAGVFEALTPGVYTVRVQGRRAGAGAPDSGSLLVQRCVVTSIDANRVLRVPLSGACLGISCPAADGDPAFSECLGGRCVDPRCDPDDASTASFCCDRTSLGDACDEPPTLCEADGDCPDGPSCGGPAMCVSRVCVTAEPDSCGDDAYCDTVADACLPVAGGGTMDAGPGDAGPEDSGPEYDAAQDDAGTADAPADLDAPADDAPAAADARATDVGRPLDAPIDARPVTVDAPLDAGRDAGSCGRTVLWLDGAGSDSITRIATDRSGAVYLVAQLSELDLLPGLGGGGLVALDASDRVLWRATGVGPVLDLAADDGTLLVLGQRDVFRVNAGTGAVVTTLASFTPPMSSAQLVAIAEDGAGSFVVGFYAAAPVTWAGAALGNAADQAVFVWAAVDGSPRRTWTLSAGFGLPGTWDGARAGADVVFVGEAGTELCELPGTCSTWAGGYYGVRLPRTGAARFDAFDVPRFQVAADASRNAYATGSSGATGGRLSSVSATGTRRWSVPAPGRADVAHDPGRGLVWVSGLIEAPLVYPTDTITLVGANPTIVVLAFDEATGALVASHRFPGTISYGGELVVTADGTVVLGAGSTVTFDACATTFPAPPPVRGSTGAFVLRIRP